MDQRDSRGPRDYQQRSYNQQRPSYPPRDDRRQSGPRDYNQRPSFNRNQGRPQQGGWNPRPNNNRRPQGDRPAFQQKKLPGKGNPKTNYLRIKPGTTFTLKGKATQVKLLATDSYEELQFAMNAWLAKHEDCEIVDIKYSVAAYYGCSCCIIYYPVMEFPKTTVYKPELVKAEDASGGSENTGAPAVEHKPPVSQPAYDGDTKQPD